MKDDDRKINLSKTSLAISRRDRVVPRLLAFLEKAPNANQFFDPVYKKILQIEESVGIAFGEDTKHLNNPETCRMCVRAGEPGIAPGEREESFVRRMVRKWKDENENLESIRSKD